MGVYILCCFCFLASYGFVTSQDSLPEVKGGPEIYKLHITSNIRYRYATTNVISKIANSDDKAKEIFFKVTLPKAAFITYFDMTIDGVVYPGEVKEKEKAKKQYDAAVSRGESAGQVTQQARDSNVFKVSVNVAAGKKVYFNMTYEELLERRFGKYQHVINIDPGQVVRDLQVKVDIEESRDIVQLLVPDLRTSSSKALGQTQNSLAVISQPSANHSVVTYNPSEEVQRNYSATGLSGQFVVQYDVERNQDGGEIQVVDGYFVHYFAPQGLPPVDKNVLFILDASGSMSGTKIQQVKQAMRTILRDLKPTDKFGIVLFEAATNFKTPRLLDVTPENIQKGLDIITNYRALGGTNINAAILDSMQFLNASEDSSRPAIIIFLTDGEPTSGISDTKQIMKNVAAENQGRYALFSLGFGFGTDFPFLQKMSLQNNGFARKIYEDADASLQLEGFYKEVSTPVMSNVNITYLDDVVNADTLTTTSFPNYFDGAEIVVAGRLADNVPDYVTCIVAGIGQNGSVTLGGGSSGVEAPRSDLSRFTERMWAYLSIKKLIKDMDLVNNKTEKEDLKQQALELSLKYGFVTPFTSMVVTKPETADNTTSQVTDLQDADTQRGDTYGNIARSYNAPLPPANLVGYAPGSVGGGQGIGHSYDMLVDSDPHVMIPLSGLQNPVCYDIDGNHGDVFRLIHDSQSGLLVDGQIITRKINTQNKKYRSYFGSISISSPLYDVHISPLEIKLNGKTVTWKTARLYRSEHLSLDITSDNTVRVAVDKGIVFSILRHTTHKTPYLGFYIKDGSGLSKHVHGLIGQFQHQMATINHSDSHPLDGVPTTIFLQGSTRGHYSVEARLGTRRNEETNQKVTCWHVRNNGRGLVEGRLRDYKVKGVKSFSYRTAERNIRQ